MFTRAADCRREVVDKNEEQHWSKDCALGHPWEHVTGIKGFFHQQGLFVCAGGEMMSAMHGLDPGCPCALSYVGDDDGALCRMPLRSPSHWMTLYSWPSANPLTSSWVTFMIWVSHDLLVLKPCWVSVRRLFSSKWVIRCLAIMCSKTLQVTDVNDTDLQLVVSYFAPFLKMRLTSVSLYSLGTYPHWWTFGRVWCIVGRALCLPPSRSGGNGGLGRLLYWTVDFSGASQHQLAVWLGLALWGVGLYRGQEWNLCPRWTLRHTAGWGCQPFFLSPTPRHRPSWVEILLMRLSWQIWCTPRTSSKAGCVDVHSLPLLV